MIKKFEKYFLVVDPEEGPVLNDRGVVLALVFFIIAILIVSYTG